jgi:hypothetical protein
MKMSLYLSLSLALLGLLGNAQVALTQPLPSSETGEVAEVSQFLQSAGLTVKNIARSHWEGTFKNEQQAAFIETDKGVVEVVIFSKGTDPFNLRIASQVVKDARGRLRYLYTLAGLPTNGDAANIDAAYPLYFTIYQNWFLITQITEIESVIKAKIHGKRAAEN